MKGSSACVFGGFWETPFILKTSTSHFEITQTAAIMFSGNSRRHETALELTFVELSRARREIKMSRKTERKESEERTNIEEILEN